MSSAKFYLCRNGGVKNIALVHMTSDTSDSGSGLEMMLEEHQGGISDVRVSDRMDSHDNGP